MRRKPKVGDRVRAARDIWDTFASTTIPAGTSGVVIADGPDAAYGMVNVRFESPGSTDGFPTMVWGPDPMADIVEDRS